MANASAYRDIQEPMLKAGGMTADHFMREGTPGLFRVFPSPDGMLKSSYSPDPLVHEGVKTVYVHATSPLRRFADVVVQRQLAADVFLNTRPPYDRKDMEEMARYITDMNREFLLRLQSGQRRFSMQLDHHLRKGRIGGEFKEKVVGRLKDGKVTKYDVFKLLAVSNGHSSDITEVQRIAFVWLKNQPHFLNDYVNFVKEEKRWGYPIYPEQNGALVAKMTVEDQTRSSEYYPVNGDQRMSRNMALLNLLESLLDLGPEEHEVFPRAS